MTLFGTPASLTARLIALPTITLMESEFYDNLKTHPIEFKKLKQKLDDFNLRVIELQDIHLKNIIEKRDIYGIVWKEGMEIEPGIFEQLNLLGIGPSKHVSALLEDLDIDPRRNLCVDSLVELWAQLNGPGLTDDEVTDFEIDHDFSVSDYFLKQGLILDADFVETYKDPEVRPEQNKIKVFIRDRSDPLSDDPGLQIKFGVSDYWTNTAIERTWEKGKGSAKVFTSNSEKLSWSEAFSKGSLRFKEHTGNMVIIYANLIGSDNRMLFIRRGRNLRYLPLSWQSGIDEQVDPTKDDHSRGPTNSTLFNATIRALDEELGLLPEIHYSIGRMELLALTREVENLNVDVIFHIPLNVPTAEVYNTIPLAKDKVELDNLRAVDVSSDSLASILRFGPVDWQKPDDIPEHGKLWHPSARFRLLVEMFRLFGPDNVFDSLSRVKGPA